MTQLILTCSPQFIDLALNEIRRSHSQIALLEHLTQGYLLLEAPCSFDSLTSLWRHRLPIYLHHAFPVDEILRLDGTERDLSRLKRAAQHFGGAVVQVRSTIETTLCYTLADVQQCLNGKHLYSDLQPPHGQIFSILIHQNAAGVRAYNGISQAEQNLSPWPGGQMPVTEDVSNGAGYKLLEALAAFSIRLRQGDHALDLGASPGAWTTLLRKRGLRVTAVAPTPLYPWLTLDEGVIHQPMLAEEFLSRCQDTFDLIVNDMKLDPQDSARLMVAYADHLRSEGIAIMTLKLRNRNRERVMDHTFRILRKQYKVIQVRQLVSNKQEVTLFLRRKPLE